jgi:hypothetical protein
LNQQLQSTRAIALVSADVSVASTMRTALKLAGDDETGVFDVVEIGLGGSLEQPPVLAVDGNRCLYERIDLVRPPELLKTLYAILEVGSDAFWLGLRADGQSSVAVVGVFKISLREQSIKHFTVLRSLGTDSQGKCGEQNGAARRTDGDKTE